MKNTLSYKGYIGSIEFDQDDGLFYGQVLGIRSLVSYEGSDARGLLADFQEAIDSYLADCAAEGKEPEKAYKGSFNVRVKPEIHKKLALYSYEHAQTLNKTAEEAFVALVG